MDMIFHPAYCTHYQSFIAGYTYQVLPNSLFYVLIDKRFPVFDTKYDMVMKACHRTHSCKYTESASFRRPHVA